MKQRQNYHSNRLLKCLVFPLFKRAERAGILLLLGMMSLMLSSCTHAVIHLDQEIIDQTYVRLDSPDYLMDASGILGIDVISTKDTHYTVKDNDIIVDIKIQSSKKPLVKNLDLTTQHFMLLVTMDVLIKRHKMSDATFDKNTPSKAFSYHRKFQIYRHFTTSRDDFIQDSVEQRQTHKAVRDLLHRSKPWIFKSIHHLYKKQGKPTS